MVSTGQITAMILAVVLPLAVAVAVYIVIGKHSKKRETGLLGAASYGVLGYLWQYFIYLMLVMSVSNLGWVRSITKNYVVSSVIYGLLCGIFVAMGMYWGVYLTNQRQKSLYRSTVIGLGFGLGNAGWNIFVPYGMSLYYSYQINAGIYAGQAGVKEKILATSCFTMYLDAYRSILLMIIYTAVALILGKFYLEKNKVSAWGTPVVIQVFISLSNAFMQEYLPAAVSTVAILVLLSAMALYSGYLIFIWIRTGEIKLLK